MEAEERAEMDQKEQEETERREHEEAARKAVEYVESQEQLQERWQEQLQAMWAGTEVHKKMDWFGPQQKSVWKEQEACWSCQKKKMECLAGK